MTVDDVPVEIYSLLYQLGLTANYTGFFHTAYAVYLVSGSPQRLDRAIKYLYAEVAEHYSTTPGAVERNIRASAARVWKKAPDRLCQLFDGALDRRPSNTVFLAGLAARIHRTSAP